MKKKLLAAACALALCLSLSPAYAKNTETGDDTAPVAENFELCTYRNVSVGGQLAAVDPDGDPVTYHLTTEPVKGTVEIQENGEFVYTPNEGKRGRDYFGYKAVDCDGNESQEATVIISIKKQKTAVTYSDMTGHAEEYAAVLLAEEGICTGQRIGETYLFSPDQEISRSEFLALCMELTGEPVLGGVMTTGFGDDAEIPAWSKSYVSTALMNGDIQGYSNGEAVVFDAQRAITRAEAAVMLDRLLQTTPVSVQENAAVPTWASQSVANLTSCDIYPSGSDSAAALTRADAAQMLASAMDVLERR